MATVESIAAAMWWAQGPSQAGWAAGPPEAVRPHHLPVVESGDDHDEYEHEYDDDEVRQDSTEEEDRNQASHAASSTGTSVLEGPSGQTTTGSSTPVTSRTEREMTGTSHRRHHNGEGRESRSREWAQERLASEAAPARLDRTYGAAEQQRGSRKCELQLHSPPG
jgi:hypothetical protein